MMLMAPLWSVIWSLFSIFFNSSSFFIFILQTKNREYQLKPYGEILLLWSRNMSQKLWHTRKKSFYCAKNTKDKIKNMFPNKNAIFMAHWLLYSFFMRTIRSNAMYIPCKARSSFSRNYRMINRFEAAIIWLHVIMSNINVSIYFHMFNIKHN